MDEYRLDSKVVVITGAGGGLGRAHARALAARGALVVVNDLGTAIDGTGRSSGPADEVVQEIIESGGTAIADYSDVSAEAGAATLVQCALDNFGRIDAVINNAGTYHLRPLTELTMAEFTKLFEVHVLGTLRVSRAAWPHLCASGAGRVVNTISEAFLGYRDQGSYGAAKGAIFTLTRVMALEGAESGIKANCIVPSAASRMGALYAEHNDIPAEAVGPQALPPGPTAAVATFLVHPDCPVSGHTISVNGGRITRWEVVQSQGAEYGPDLTPEQVAQSWPDITDLGAATARSVVL